MAKLSPIVLIVSYWLIVVSCERDDGGIQLPTGSRELEPHPFLPYAHTETSFLSEDEAIEDCSCQADTESEPAYRNVPASFKATCRGEEEISFGREESKGRGKAKSSIRKPP